MPSSKSTYTYTPEDAPPDLASFASYLLICNVESSGHYAAPYTIHVDALPIDEGSLTPYSVDAKLIVKMADFKMRAIQKIMADLNGRHNDTSSESQERTCKPCHWILSGAMVTENDYVGGFQIVVRPVPCKPA